MRYVYDACRNDRTTHRLGFEWSGDATNCNLRSKWKPVGHLRSAASERAQSASGIWEIGVFSVVKRAVYKRSVGRGQGEG